MRGSRGERADREGQKSKRGDECEPKPGAGPLRETCIDRRRAHPKTLGVAKRDSKDRARGVQLAMRIEGHAW